MSEKKGWDSASEAYAPFEAFTGQFSRTAAVALSDVLHASSARASQARVMDVAAGTGASTFAVCKTLAELCRELEATAEVVATDFSESMLKILTEKLARPVWTLMFWRHEQQSRKVFCRCPLEWLMLRTSLHMKMDRSTLLSAPLA